MKFLESSYLKTYLDNLFPKLEIFINHKNNYELLIGIVLSAQTTDVKVNEVTVKLFADYPDFESLSKADENDLNKILYSLGIATRKSYYCISIAKQILNDYNGQIPDSYDELIKLKGVGQKSANVYLSCIGNPKFFGVDTHIQRIAVRLKLANSVDSPEKVKDNMIFFFDGKDLLKRHLQLIAFGRSVCKSLNPNCSNCELLEYCNYHEILKNRNNKLTKRN